MLWFQSMPGLLNSARKHLFAFACFGLALIVPCSAQAPIGEVVASDASVKGSVLLVSSGTRVMSGSSITAGRSTALLKLLRGGEVRVCPLSSVSLSNSQSGRDLVLGMGTGAIETHYVLGSSADTVLTPDFRILLAGPGNFHVAIGADSRGNTCVRSLERNTASILVTEMMGDGVYQVRPGEQAYFRDGRIANLDRSVPPDCGCPAPAAVMNAQAQPVTPAPSNLQTPVAAQTQAVANQPPQQTTSSAATPWKIELPPNSPEAVLAEHGTPSSNSDMIVTSPNGEIHVQIDAPFVFNAEEAVPPAPVVASLHLSSMPAPLMAQPRVMGPPGSLAGSKVESPGKGSKQNAQDAKPPRKGFFGHVRSFFATIFR